VRFVNAFAFPNGRSEPNLVGGGTYARPGEISLANHGVLFLDELPEFHRNLLESLRQPLEDGEITIGRASASFSYPARFMLVGAMNPCKCGNFGDTRRECHCTPREIIHYRGKVSGPLLDRIDIHIEVPSIAYKELASKTEGTSSAEMRGQVIKARQIQAARFKNEKIFTNSQMATRQIKKYCKIDEACENLLKQAIDELAGIVHPHRFPNLPVPAKLFKKPSPQPSFWKPGSDRLRGHLHSEP
jgi:magnesium chelatase family protein